MAAFAGASLVALVSFGFWQTWWLAALLAAAQRIEPAAEASSNSP